MSAPFNSWQLKFFRAFAEAMFDGFDDRAISIDQIVANFVRLFELVKGPPRQRIRFALTWGWVLMGSNFHNETVADRRRKIEDRLIAADGDTLQDFARLKALTYASYYGHWLPGDEDGNFANPVLAQIGFTLPKFRHRDSNEPQLTARPDVEIAAAHVLLPSQVPDEVDYIVVGSGSGGAMAAHNLAPYGKVLVIEAGPFVPSPAITFEERLMGATLFKEGALQATADNDIVIF